LQYKFCITKATLTAHFDWNGNEFEHQTQLLCCLFFLSLLLSAVSTALWTGHVPYIFSVRLYRQMFLSKVWHKCWVQQVYIVGCLHAATANWKAALPAAINEY
jgi:hypothetical protein